MFRDFAFGEVLIIDKGGYVQLLKIMAKDASSLLKGMKFLGVFDWNAVDEIM